MKCEFVIFFAVAHIKRLSGIIIRIMGTSLTANLLLLSRHDDVTGMIPAMYARNMILFTLLCRRDAVYYCGALSTGGDGHSQVFVHSGVHSLQSEANKHS
ncbi:hypothetical protein DK872_01065 [Kosakonia sp. MH5]|nr:hypothetical protein AW40_05185 [Kosakonia radicincitans UMEnt01/12]NCF03899.1 hypothetical protein [Kosakonia sp. MH5]